MTNDTPLRSKAQAVQDAAFAELGSLTASPNQLRRAIAAAFIAAADALATTREDRDAAPEAYAQCVMNGMDFTVNELRGIAAALAAQPQVQWPTDQQIAETFTEGCRDTGKAGEPAFLGGARAVLARWGRPAAPPAEGEVGELVAWLRENAVDERPWEGWWLQS